MSDRQQKFGDFYKTDPEDKIWWLDTLDVDGEFLFSFDQKKVYNLFHDYPWALTPEQKAVFDQDQPYWANFFKERRQENPPEGWKSAEMTV
jgi:hypothetical protein|nr:MAG TPA_asm: hypothetical protein [Caudoviricetes sp.]